MVLTCMALTCMLCVTIIVATLTLHDANYIACLKTTRSVRMHRRHTFLYLVAKNHASAGEFSTGTVRQYLELIKNSLIFLNKGFVHYLCGVICSRQTLLWHVPGSPEDKSARNIRPPCSFKFGSIQYRHSYILTAELL